MRNVECILCVIILNYSTVQGIELAGSYYSLFLIITLMTSAAAEEEEEAKEDDIIMSNGSITLFFKEINTNPHFLK